MSKKMIFQKELGLVDGGLTFEKSRIGLEKANHFYLITGIKHKR